MANPDRAGYPRLAVSNPEPLKMPRTLAKGGGGTHDGGMEARVAKLEQDVGEIKSILARLEPALTKIRDDVSELKGRVSHMPTLWQIAAVILGINAGIVAVSALLVRLTGS